MENWLLATVIALLSGSAIANVKVVKDGPVVDGNLEDACWKKATWTGGFQSKLSDPNKVIKNPTSFAIVSDRRNIYVGLRCADANMESVRKEELGSLWAMNQVNLFLAPSGSGFDFYQFAFSANHGLKEAFAYSESGAILLEPEFLPEWEVKTVLGEKEWTAEVRIPVNAFYHTRAENWKHEWMVNVCRIRVASDGTEKSCWSPVDSSFRETDKFRPVAGFPARDWKDDISLTGVQFIPSGIESGRIAGVVSANLHIRNRGTLTLSTTASEKPLAFFQQAGDKVVRIPAFFDKNGTYDVGLKVSRTDKEGDLWPLDYNRTAKVRVNYKAIDVTITKPSYRQNFYPGQDSSEISGTVKVAAGGEVKVSVEGPGIPHEELSMTVAAGESKPRSFSFKTPGFAEGEAVVTVVAGGESKSYKVRKLATTGHKMSWVENGNLVIDGKSVLSRRIAHPGYCGGAWLDEIFKTNVMHDTTEYVGERGLQFMRLVPGSEAREGTKDQVPSQEVFDALAKAIDEAKDADFAFWYISDEPECRKVSPVYLHHVYEFIKERDPYHVLRISSRTPKDYIDCYDWVETHPYINPKNLPDGGRGYGRPIEKVGDYVSEVADLKRPDKIIGFYTTAFAFTEKNASSDYPTFAEYVTHAWAGMIRGARTIIPYAYHDIGDRPSILEGTRFVFRQLEVLEQFILADRRTTLKKSPEQEVVKYEFGGDSLTVAVDFKTLKVTLDATGDYAAKLPSYDETQALVDKLEYERTHGGSLLVGKWPKMKIDGSGRTPSGRKKKLPSRVKLTDGVRNVYAGRLIDKKENWLEFDLTDVGVEFSRAAVWGEMRSAKIMLKQNGIWGEPVEGVRDGQWAFRFAFPRGVCPEAVRMLFNAGRVDVYEFEVFK